MASFFILKKLQERKDKRILNTEQPRSLSKQLENEGEFLFMAVSILVATLLIERGIDGLIKVIGK